MNRQSKQRTTPWPKERTGLCALLPALLWVGGAWPAYGQSSPVQVRADFVGQPGGIGNGDGPGGAAHHEQGLVHAMNNRSNGRSRLTGEATR